MDRSDFKGKCVSCIHLQTINYELMIGYMLPGYICDIWKETFDPSKLLTNTCDDYDYYGNQIYEIEE